MGVDWESLLGSGGNGGDGGGSSNGSGGGSSSSISSSSGGGGAGPSQEQLQRLIISYRDILRRWGIRPDKNLLNLIERAARSMWTTTQFVDRLRHTPEYRQQFRGIQWRTGMTEGQYNQTFAQYKARAQDIGEMITRREFSKLLRRGVTFDEFSDRVDALNAIEEYAPLWKQFKFELEQSGVRVPGGDLTKKELTKFLMGLGSPKWEQVWERVYLTTQLEKVAGIGVVEQGKGESATPDAYEITRGDMLKLIKQVEALSPGFEVESLTGKNFAEIGTRLRAMKPQYLQRFGLTTNDILTMELGGPNAAKIADRAQRLLATQEAFFEPRATPQAAQQVGRPTVPQEEDLPQSI